jgi:hypothetical protein
VRFARDPPPTDAREATVPTAVIDGFFESVEPGSPATVEQR